MRFSVFDDVRDQLVSDDNPARVDGDLDYERCAALHNAIVKYGWTASGRLIDELPLTTCWEANEEEWEDNADRLQPSMIEFLKRAYDTELPDTSHYTTSNQEIISFPTSSMAWLGLKVMKLMVCSMTLQTILATT